jgi:hypothetical protein
VYWALGFGLASLVVFAVLRLLLRRTWLAAVALAVFLSSMTGGAPPTAMDFSVSIIGSSALVFLLARFGLVAAITGAFANRLLSITPLTTDFSRWYAWQGICAVLVLLTLGAYAFWANLGGRPLWREED